MHKLTKTLKSEFHRSRNLVFVVFVFCMAAVFSFIATSDTRTISAASTSGFQAGNIISDAVMSNSKAMTLAEIQDFLSSKNKCDNRDYNEYLRLTNRYPNIKWHWEGEPYNGHFVCMAEERFGDTSSEIGTGMTAAEIIYAAAQDNQINPQVLLVLLQKESSLITDKIPNSLDYSKATGYGCPDTAACDTKYAGFKNQVYRAAELFRYTLDHGSVSYPEGRKVYIGYNPASSCGGTQVYIENRATASLYRYTPYQPNAAALNAGYGTGDACSAYGNRNFYLYFTDWFGSTQAAIDGEPASIPEGTYILTSKLSQSRILGVSDQNAELANVTDGEQAWHIKHDPDTNLYTIINNSNNSMLSVENTDLSSQPNIATSDAASGCSQQWKIYHTKDGYYTFESACSNGFVIDTANGASSAGTNVQISIAGKSDSQKWQLKSARTIEDGIYTINPAGTASMAADVTGGSTANGANIQIYEDNKTLSQKWFFSYDEASGYYTISNPLSNKVIDASYGSMKNGTNIWLYESNNTCSQQWNVFEAESGQYVITSACSMNMAIEFADGKTKNGANIRLYTYSHERTSEFWQIAKFAPLADGDYTFTTRLSQQHVLNNSDNNVNIYQQSVEQPKTWHIEYDSTGDYYTISNPLSNKVIDASYGSMKNGTNIWLYESNNTCSQQWRIIESHDGYYAISSTCSIEYMLDVTHGVAQNNTNVQLYKANGTLSQEWQIEPSI